jgi:MOSC domain-containing protein YiiM
MATVTAVHTSGSHTFSKESRPEVELVAGLGVVGDAHMGAQVKHRSRVRADPTQPNLRQVHLIHDELFDLVAEQGFTVSPGDLGENITTNGIDLLSLPAGAVLKLGEQALVVITGLRNPCVQIEGFQEGLLGAVLERNPDTGTVTRRGGIMGMVVLGGRVQPGDPIEVALPPEPHRPLERV